MSFPAKAGNPARRGFSIHHDHLSVLDRPVEPSSLEQIMSDRDNRSGVAVLVPAKIDQPKAVRVNVTLPEDVLAQIDRYAEAHGFTRSGLLVQAAKRLMTDEAA
ncbi:MULTISPECIES: type II toxin-antitoxin system HicB family antitoxin [unclassified Bradyrhizobium]|uniref:type II toxin-antitoxin system HicB family antitoxin n=1 Tax=unclassified Bradyrhizobium TaxID=2631580 RepID=UPI0028E3E59D|nr:MULTISPECIES: type II toxin-antitoxin system HicB family antitoxin [unclassified Bradyrhizobium]